LEHFRKAIARGSTAQAEWESRLEAFTKENPELAAEFQRVINRQLPKGWDANLPTFTSADAPIATRIASGKTIAVLNSHLPEMMGGSADLAPSTFTNMEGAGNFEPENWAGRNMHFGIREHAMGAILNGMALHRGLIPFGGTFLIFSDYMRPPMRLAAMNGLPVIYVFTHDSIAMGEDGPTHQPVEQLVGLRSIPGMVVIRPAYYTEWNISSNPRDPLHDGPFAAAFVTKIIMEAHGLVQGYSFWTFSDIFEENYFPSVPFHGGFGLLNLHGIAKPHTAHSSYCITWVTNYWKSTAPIRR
jgi:transketolase